MYRETPQPPAVWHVTVSYPDEGPATLNVQAVFGDPFEGGGEERPVANERSSEFSEDMLNVGS